MEISKEKLIADFLDLERELGKQPSALKYRSLKHHSLNTVDRIFGKPGWANLLMCIGREVPHGPFKTEISAEHLIQDYHDLEKKLCKQPNITDFITHCHSGYLLDRVFGKPGWRNMLSQIGKEPLKRVDNPSKEHLIHDFIDLEKSTGRQPSCNDYFRNCHSISSLEKIFGKPTWKNFLLEMNKIPLREKKYHCITMEENVIIPFLRLLSPAEKHVAESRIFVTEGKRMMLKTIGRAFGVTTERVRQIENAVIVRFGEYQKAQEGVKEGDTPIICLSIRNQYKTRLIKRGFHNLSDLLPLGKNKLINIPGIGVKTVTSLKKALGLSNDQETTDLDIPFKERSIKFLPIPDRCKRKLKKSGFNKISDIFPFDERKLQQMPGITTRTVTILRDLVRVPQFRKQLNYTMEDMPVTCLEISHGCKKKLLTNGCYFISDIYPLDDAKLLKIKGIGKHSILEVQKALYKLNREFYLR